MFILFRILFVQYFQFSRQSFDKIRFLRTWNFLSEQNTNCGFQNLRNLNNHSGIWNR